MTIRQRIANAAYILSWVGSFEMFRIMITSVVTGVTIGSTISPLTTEFLVAGGLSFLAILVKNATGIAQSI